MPLASKEKAEGWCSREKSGSLGWKEEAVWGRVYKQGILPGMVGQCDVSEEVQWQMEDVHGLHWLE